MDSCRAEQGSRVCCYRAGHEIPHRFVMEDRCPMCGDRMRSRIAVQVTPRGDIEHVDRICDGCGWVDFDDN